MNTCSCNSTLSIVNNLALEVKYLPAAGFSIFADLLSAIRSTLESMEKTSSTLENSLKVMFSTMKKPYSKFVMEISLKKFSTDTHSVSKMNAFTTEEKSMLNITTLM
jgi:C-terminal processing protease CtpA/Prc